MTIFLSIFILFLSITVAVWNAYVILWGVTKNIPHWDEVRIKYSKAWHLVGWILRFEFALVIGYLLTFHPNTSIDYWQIGNWTMIFLIMMGFMYDFVINLLRNKLQGSPSLWYVDNKGVNAVFLKIFKSEKSVWIFRFVFLVLSIISLIAHELVN